MPIRIKVPEKSQNVYTKRRRKRVIYACSVSAAVLIIVSAILFSIHIFVSHDTPDSFIQYVEPTPDIPIPKPKESLAGGAAPSNPSIAITTADVTTDVNLEPSFDFGTEIGFGGPGGDGMGLGDGGLGPAGGGGIGNGMGSTEKTNSAFRGEFWDLKRLRSGKTAPVEKSITRNGDALKLLSKIYNDKWNRFLLEKYYKSSVSLYAPCFYMPFSPDTEACAAYDPSKKMGLKQSRWVAIYTARVKAPKTGKYRFVAAGDSLIAVRFNNKNVLATGIHNLEEGVFYGMRNEGYRADKDFFEYSTCEPWNDGGETDDGNGLYGFMAGTPFEVKEGEYYDMEVMVSEIGGGYFGFCLLIDDMDDPIKPTSKDGLPVFQLFRTVYIAPTAEESYANLFTQLDPSEGRTDPPYDPDSNVWAAEPLR